MNRDAMKVDRIQWERAIPALRLLHAVRLACTAQVLIPALIVVAVSLEGTARLAPETDSQTGLPMMIVPEEPFSDELLHAPFRPLTLSEWLRSFALEPVATAIRDTVTVTVFPGGTGSQVWERLGMNLLLLGFGGAAICFATARSFCRQSQEGIVRSLTESFSSTRSILLSIVLSGLLIALSRGLVAAWVGFAHVTGIETAASGVTVVVAWILALLCCLTLVVVMSAWGLGVAAIGTDRCDGSDAVSRGINYVLSHRLFSALLLSLTFGIAWVASKVVEFLSNAAAGIAMVSLQSSTELTLIGRLPGIVHVVVDAFRLGVFFSGLTLVYLLLREREDGIRISELDGGQQLRGER